MKRIVLAVFAALLALAAPAAADGSYVYIPIYIPAAPVGPQWPEPGDYSKVRKVAIISAIGLVELQKAVPIFPDRTGKLAEATNWKLDDTVAATLKKYLGGKFEFVDVAYDPAKIFNIRPTIWHAGELTSYLKTLPNQDIDAFIVVRPNYQGAVRLESRRMGQVVLWVDYRFEIIDAHTYKDIAVSSSRYQVREGAMPGFPGLVLDSSFELNDKMMLAPDKIEMLRTKTQQLLDVTMVETIRSLKFGVTLPPVGDHSLLPPPPTNRSAGVKTIAITSAIGDRLRMYKPGGMLTKAIRTEVGFADQDIDAAVETMVHDSLAKYYTIKTIPVDRKVLTGKWWTKRDEKFLINVPPSNEVDAYLLILKDATKNIDGPGILHDGNWTSDWTYLGCNYVILLVDAKTSTPIIAARGVMSSKYAHAWPSVKLDNSLWPTTKSPDALTPGTAPMIKDALLKLLQDSLPETLYRLGVNTGAQPPQEPAGTALPAAGAALGEAPAQTEPPKPATAPSN